MVSHLELLAGPESVCSEGESEVHPVHSSKDGQCDSYRLDGSNPLIGDVRSGHRSVEVVHPKIDQNPCRASTREGECAGRLATTPLRRLERLEAVRGSVHQAKRIGGAIHHGPFCLQNEQAAASVLQLEAGPTCICSGCTINPLDQYLFPLFTLINRSSRRESKR